MKSETFRAFVFLISLVACIILFVWGFYAPPYGDINKHVLYAGAMLMVWPMTWTFPDALRAMNEWRISAGTFTAEAKGNNNHHNEEKK